MEDEREKKTLIFDFTKPSECISTFKLTTSLFLMGTPDMDRMSMNYDTVSWMK